MSCASFVNYLKWPFDRYVPTYFNEILFKGNYCYYKDVK